MIPLLTIGAVIVAPFGPVPLASSVALAELVSTAPFVSLSCGALPATVRLSASSIFE